MTIKECTGNSCPLCEMGVPRKVMITVFDHTTGASIQFKMNQELYDKIYGKECPICKKEIDK